LHKNRGTCHICGDITEEQESCREAVLPPGPATGGQCRCNGTRDIKPPTSTEEWCFLLGPVIVATNYGIIWCTEPGLTEAFYVLYINYLISFLANIMYYVNTDN
jgi:hypothetical protein